MERTFKKIQFKLKIKLTNSSLSNFTLDRIMRNIEHGIFAMYYNCLDGVGKKSCHTSKISIFGTLEEFIEENSSFSNLGIANFRSIMLYYFLFCSLVFVTFCMHHLVKLIKWMRILIFVKLCWLQVKQLLLKLTLFVLKCLKIRI